MEPFPESAALGWVIGFGIGAAAVYQSRTHGRVHQTEGATDPGQIAKRMAICAVENNQLTTKPHGRRRVNSDLAVRITAPAVSWPGHSRARAGARPSAVRNPVTHPGHRPGPAGGALHHSGPAYRHRPPGSP